MESLKSTIIRHIDNVFLSLCHGSRSYSYDNLSVVRVSLNPVNSSNAADKNKNVLYSNNTYLIYVLLAHHDMNPVYAIKFTW